MVRLTAEIVIGKTCPVIGRHNGHSDNGGRKEILATKPRNRIAKHWRTLPSAHEAKSIRKEADQECKGTQKQRAGIDRAIPQRQKQNLGHVLDVNQQ